MPSKAPSPADAGASVEPGGLDFETALGELETLVNQMEAGEMSLEASLAAFERGIRLTRHCQTALREAELKVKKLTEDNRLEDLDACDVDDD
jgi:exodeoxyribonuclease VII small subunit